MAQSVELTLDAAAEAALVAQWDRLAAAGLARPRRPQPHGQHLPHVTLYAADAIPEAAECALPKIVAGIERVEVGSEQRNGVGQRQRGAKCRGRGHGGELIRPAIDSFAAAVEGR